MTDAAQPEASEASAPHIRVVAQYVKDLSFENPNAPDSLRAGPQGPAIDLSVNVNARRREGDEGLFEVDLKISAKAARENSVAFMVEIVYSGLFLLEGFPLEQSEPILLIECPRILFPFARRLVADVTRDGGFPPLMIDPIDFAGLYQNQLMRNRSQEAGAAPQV